MWRSMCQRAAACTEPPPPPQPDKPNTSIPPHCISGVRQRALACACVRQRAPACANRCAARARPRPQRTVRAPPTPHTVCGTRTSLRPTRRLGPGHSRLRHRRGLCQWLRVSGRAGAHPPRPSRRRRSGFGGTPLPTRLAVLAAPAAVCCVRAACWRSVPPRWPSTRWPLTTRNSHSQQTALGAGVRTRHATHGAASCALPPRSAAAAWRAAQRNARGLVDSPRARRRACRGSPPSQRPANGAHGQRAVSAQPTACHSSSPAPLLLCRLVGQGGALARRG